MDAPEVPQRRKRLPRAAREQQLIEIAERLFTERGLQATSMDDLAEEAGVSKPVIYDHFGSKDGLVVAIILRARAELLHRTVQAEVGMDTPEEALLAGLRAFFEFIEGHGAAWAVLLDEHSLSGDSGAAVEAIRRQQVDYVVAMFATWFGPSEAVDHELWAEALIGACERLALWRQRRPEVTVEQVTGKLADMVWRGLSPVRT